MVSRLDLMRTTLPVLAILLASVATCRNRAPQERTQPIARADSESDVVYETSREELKSAPLDRAREILRASRTLRPDRRFLLAAAELVRLRDGRPPPPVRVSLTPDGWRIQIGSESVGTLAVVPGFEESQVLLRRWALQCLPAWRRPSQEPDGLAELERQARDPFGSGPIRALQESESLWRKGVRHPRLLDVAGVASLSLLAQSLDQLGMTDRLQAKALALLAARESISGPQPETAAFLARWLGYRAEAEALASKVPETSLIRLWVLDQADALRKDAEGTDSAPLGRYLYLLRVAEKEGLEAWARALGNQRQPVPDGLPLIRTALNAPDFGPEIGNARMLLHALEADISGDARAAVFWEELRKTLLKTPASEAIARLLGLLRAEPSEKTSIVERFERSLGKKFPAPGAFWNPETAGTYYRSLFYSALYTIGTYELDRRSSARDAMEFADTLKGAPPGPGELFQRWFSDLARFEDDRSKIAPLIQGLDGFEPLGRSAIKRLADELLRTIPYNDPQRLEVVKRYAMHLDTRPWERTAYGSLSMADLLDPRGYETYYGGSASALGGEAGGVGIAWANYRGDSEFLRRAAADRARPAYERWAALEVLAKKGLATEAELVERAGEIFLVSSRDSAGRTKIIKFLRERGRFKEAERLLRRWLESHPDEPTLTRAFYTADLTYVLLEQGRGREAWNTIEPWISTWKADVLTAGAFALNSLQRRDEAWKLAQQCLERYPTGPWVRAEVARLLWTQGRYAEVPALYQDSRHPPNPRDWTDTIAPAFGNVFAKLPLEEVERAFAPLVSSGVNPWFLMSFSEPFAKFGRFDAAAGLLLQVTRVRPAIGPLDPALNLYRYLERWKGEEGAIAWVRENVSAASRKDLLHAALDERLFPLFWSAVELPTPMPDGEDVWLLQATAAALKPDAAGASSEGVRAHFSSSKTPEARYGRFVLGISDANELLGPPDTGAHGEAAYYLGIRALAAGRREEASDWLLVCLELAPGPSVVHRKAKRVLDRWARDQMGPALR
jgi:tetratricopeptide (TPR) repeat protein